MGRSVRQQRYQIAAELRAAGQTWVQIADALREQWPELTARSAMRLAHTKDGQNWTQSDTREAWASRFPGERAPEPKEISRWEIWPGRSGARPSLDSLDKLAQVYECAVADLLVDVFNYRRLDEANGISFDTHAISGQWEASGAATATAPSEDETSELRDRLQAATAVDAGAIELLASQLDQIRRVDRMLGARAAEAQMNGQLASLDVLRTFSIAPNQREPLARLYADAATLAGWQNLDLGDSSRAWQRYEEAKSAAGQAQPPATLAHAHAEQAYVLADMGELHMALQLVEYAISLAGTAVPPLLLAWLTAARGEIHALIGADKECRDDFDEAARLLPKQANDPDLPYVVLDEVHLERWRGNALAQLGDSTAISSLRDALVRIDASFTRARAGLHVDLAHALYVSGEAGEARVELEKARALAVRVGSARQRRRIRRLESALVAA